MKKFFFPFFFAIINIISLAQSHKIIESTTEYIKIEFNFENKYQITERIYNGEKFSIIESKEVFLREPGEPWLPNYLVNVGIPLNSKPVVKILNTTQEKIQRVFILPTPDSLSQTFEQFPYKQDIYNSNSFFPSQPVITEDYIVRYAHIANLKISPYQFNPVSRELLFNKKLIVQIIFKGEAGNQFVVDRFDDKMTDDIIKSSVINYEVAKNFTGRKINYTDASTLLDSSYWYNPQKDYYKIYLNKKGVYRITYDYLVTLGVPSAGLQNNRLELFCNGESIPIDVVDVNGDEIFNSGDYFQFVGGPAKPVDAYTRMNIYNTTNIYWFSYQADTLNYYKYIDGFPTNSSPVISNTIETLRWEKDLIYQQLGHARDDKRDYWYMAFAEARNRAPFKDYIFYIEDSLAFNRVNNKADANIRVGLHGLTTTTCSAQNGHDVTIKLNTKVLGTKQWNGQEAAVFNKSFFLGSSHNGDTVRIFADKQKFEINLFGNICDSVQSDLVLINYVELDYWRWNRTKPNYYYFISPPNNFGENRYYLWRWMRDNMKIYIPSRNELITNPDIRNDNDKSVYFVDTILVQTDYYCVADDYYLLPDSTIQNTNPSDLRNQNNRADYIIITHPLFQSAALRLADFRSSNLSGYSNPQIKIVNIFDIYNEFSYGLLNPFALNDFVKYAFENWQSPAPEFIVLLGDMSHDYRGIFPNSRKNFIPSIPFHGAEFGQLPSDNSIVSVTDNDKVPDIAIGRLACETIDEANILVDKILNYPLDNSKQWKENTILLASGLSYQDQLNFRFNYFAKELETSHLTPNGIRTTKVFNFPENAEDSMFIGSGPRMREEINNGATVVSYYGHGGGAQWDLIFTKDDIPELTNGGRLPFISSITCYTAHFDNAESFGEIFMKIPNKGAIGFWGSVSVTWWTSGHYLNKELFRNIYTLRNYNIGTSILKTVSSGISSNMIPQIVYLGDPALELVIPKHPDFEIKSSGITISPQNPLKGDTIVVAINISNLGVSFPNDSVVVQLFENIPDTSNIIGEIKLPSFGQNIITSFNWIPQEAGLYNLIVQINEKNIIDEEDHSDNTATNSFSVFDFGEPNIVKPVNGYFNALDKVDFILSDIGFYFNRNFNYRIQINDSPEFNGSILMQSPILNPVDGIVKWKSNSLSDGEYFWRAIIYDAIDTNTSPIRVFTLTNQIGNGYLSQKKQLQLFENNNVIYSPESNSLVLNTELKPPHPEDKFFLDSILISLPNDSTEASAFTTDGTYFYLTNLPFYSGVTSSNIYKIGTGLNGTNVGQNYGAIPNLSINIFSSLFYYAGSLFTCTGPSNNLLRINPITGDTSRIFLQDSLLFTLEKTNQRRGYYLYSDGVLVYNLGIGTSKYPNKFVLRTFDPAQNWIKIKEDVVFNGNTMNNVMSFFVVNNYLIAYENYTHHYLRRYDISDGSFDEEWIYGFPSRDYFNVSYDYINNFVYFTNYRPGNIPYTPAFIKYSGTYVEAQGQITSQEIGPASKWQSLEFDIDKTNSNGKYKTYLLGKNKISGNWERIDTILQPQLTLDDIDVNNYNYLKLNFALVDSSFGAGEPLKFNSLKVNYDYLPEISLTPTDMTFAPDSMLQGIDVNMNLKVYNYGYIPLDSLRMDFYLNEGDSIFFTKYISIQPDSFSVIDQTIKTDTIIFTTKIKALATSPVEEYFTFNNLIENDFYIARDSTKPVFNITFDGKEILDGDIVSSKPEVVITLKDNSPLLPKSSDFTIVYDNEPLEFDNDTLKFEIVSPYPNSETKVTWTPEIIEDGLHSLQVLAKDPSGNFFDSTSYSTTFYVFNNADLRDVYNYPNPFGDNTYFTFELRGVDVPDELRIKIFTIAGRMIEELTIPRSKLRIGFNSIYWDGRDRDGDEIANGLYFYKVIYKNDDLIKTVTQKLAKVK